MRIIVNGALGKMGKILCGLIRNSEHEAIEVDKKYESNKTLSCYTGKADVLIDFSHHSSTYELIGYAISRRIPTVIATTGHTESEKSAIKNAAKTIPIFISENFSLGISTLISLLNNIGTFAQNADMEIFEEHNKDKADFPSGTALRISKKLEELTNKNRIHISSARYGKTVGKHTLIISNGNEKITLIHEAYNRDIFAYGAIKAAEYIVNMPAGLYTMEQLDYEY